jgi:hypothetical protein
MTACSLGPFSSRQLPAARYLVLVRSAKSRVEFAGVLSVASSSGRIDKKIQEKKNIFKFKFLEPDWIFIFKLIEHANWNVHSVNP